MESFRMGGRVLWWILVTLAFLGLIGGVAAKPRKLLFDTDVDTDDFFAILYLLKHNRSDFDLQAITISANSWSDAGHAVNHIYDMLYMMNRDDILVGVGGDGGISDDGTIFPDVGGYLPLIEQGMSTTGNCRYRQAIPKGRVGRLDIDTNYGIRRTFLPQGRRRYIPLLQPTVQQVMKDTISKGPTTVFLTGSHTNFALFLMTNPQLKRNVEHIYIMGGGIRSENPTGCCPKNSTTCQPQQCGDKGNLFTGYTSNPYAEFNIFSDPFAAYQVFHSDLPITLVPLDATNTIPINEQFFLSFEQHQRTYEAQYCFQSLKIIRDTWFNDDFYTSYFMWDSFLAGVALSIIRNGDKPLGDNEFAEMQYLNITVVTSNKPYGINDGSNPFFDGRSIPKFNLQKGSIHSGHVQTGVQDPFCFVNGSVKGQCEDGYTKELTGPDSVRVLVASKAKPNEDVDSPLDREFFNSFLEVLNLPQHSGRFNFAKQFRHYTEIFYEPDFTNQTRGIPVVFDMDMSAGDFLALMYLLKAPVESIDLKGILVSGNGWANAATIDIVYDVLHMMGRDDIPVGLGNVTALGTPHLGCEYVKAIPQGSGGLIDSDTLYGLARDLPRSPRRYTAENLMKFGAPRNTARPKLRQPLAFEVWKSITSKLTPSDKITVLTNGPLTNLANIILSDNTASSIIKNVYIVGGHIINGSSEEGNVFTVPSNKYSEFNFFLDPLAAKTVIESGLDITLVPLAAQRKVTSFSTMLQTLQINDNTPESLFANRLLSLMHDLQQKSQAYQNMDVFLGELLGAVFLVKSSNLNATMLVQPISVVINGMDKDGQIIIDSSHGKLVKILDSFDSQEYYTQFATLLGDEKQSAVFGSFDEQIKMWNKEGRKYSQ